MRNLKRALSLALAVMMVIGMMVIGTSAVSISDFKDADAIVNTEAVALMADLGILVGDNAGNFNPNAKLDRMALAKITFLVGTRQTDWTPYENYDVPMSDLDVAGQYAKGAIKYCYLMGWISGNPDGTYSPKGTLQVAQVAKTLLCALGYDAETEGFVGTNWAFNTMNKAREEMLLEGVSTQDPTALISRQDACQMAYNALFRPTRTATKGANGTVYTTSKLTLGLKNHDLVKVSAKVGGNGSLTVDSVYPTATGGTTNSAQTVLTNAGYKGTPDQVGSVVTVYLKAKVNTADATTLTYDDTAVRWGAVSTAVVPGVSATLATVTSGISNLTNATTKTHRDFVGAELPADPATNAAATVTYYVNGANLNGTAPYGNGASDVKAAGNGTSQVNSGTTSDVASIVAKPGVITKFIDTTGDGKADTVSITQKTVATATTDVSVNATTGAVTIGGVGSFAKNTVQGHENIKKGDVVLYVAQGGITYIEKAKTVEGKVSGKNSNGGITVEGQVIYNSGLVASNTIASGWNVAGLKDKTYTFYLDNGDNVVAAVEKTAAGSGSSAASLPVHYGIVLDKGFSAASYQNEFTATASIYLLTSEGEKETRDLKSVTVGTTTYTLGAARNPLDNDKVSTLTYKDVIAYTINEDNSINVTELTADFTSSNTSGFTKGSAAVTVNSNQVAYANDNTVFFYIETKTGDTYLVNSHSAYVGKNVAPTYAASGSEMTVYVANDKLTANVVLVAAKPQAPAAATDETGKVAFLLDVSEYNVTTTGIEIAVAADGAAETLTINALAKEDNTALADADLLAVNLTNGVASAEDVIVDTANIEVKTGLVSSIIGDSVVITSTTDGGVGTLAAIAIATTEYKVTENTVVTVVADPTNIHGRALAVGDAVKFTVNPTTKAMGAVFVTTENVSTVTSASAAMGAAEIASLGFINADGTTHADATDAANNGWLVIKYNRPAGITKVTAVISNDGSAVTDNLQLTAAKNSYNVTPMPAGTRGIMTNRIKNGDNKDVTWKIAMTDQWGVVIGFEGAGKVAKAAAAVSKKDNSTIAAGGTSGTATFNVALPTNTKGKLQAGNVTLTYKTTGDTPTAQTFNNTTAALAGSDATGWVLTITVSGAHGVSEGNYTFEGDVTLNNGQTVTLTGTVAVGSAD